MGKAIRYISVIIVVMIMIVVPKSIFAESIFSVTIPMSLPINMNSGGEVVTAENIKIKNNSVTDIQINSMGMEMKNGWKIEDYDDDFTKKLVNDKIIGMKVNGENLNTDGTIYISNLIIRANKEIGINYDAKLPAQSGGIGRTLVANLIFVVDWVGGVPPELYNVTFTSGTGGVISGGSPQTIRNIAKGTTIRFPTVTTDNKYFFEKWVDLSDGSKVTDNIGVYRNMDIKAIFREKVYQDNVTGTKIDLTTGTIIEYVGTSRSPVIPTNISVEGVNYPITVIGNNAYASKNLNDINIPNGIVSIGEGAFRNNNTVNALLGNGSIFIPRSVTNIGADAFKTNGISRTGVTIDNVRGNVVIGREAFYRNGFWNLTDIRESDINYTGNTGRTNYRVQNSYEDPVCKVDRYGEIILDEAGYMICDMDRLEESMKQELIDKGLIKDSPNGGINSKTDPEIELEPEPEIELETESETESEMELEIEPETESETEHEIEIEPDPEPIREIHQENEIEPEE